MDLETSKAADPQWVRWIKLTSVATATVGGLVVLIMVANVVIDVGARNLLHEPIQGTFDLTKLLYVPCAAILPLAFVQVFDKHIRVDAVVDALGPNSKLLVQVFVEVLCLGVALWVGYLLVGAASTSFESGEGGVTAEWLPVWTARAAVCFGWLLMVPATVVRIRALLIGSDAGSGSSSYIQSIGVTNAE